MSLRKRLTIVSAAAAAAAVLLAALVCYAVVRNQLRGQVDSELQAQAELVLARGEEALGSNGFPQPLPSAGGPAPYSQVVGADGSVIQVNGEVSLPVDATTRAVAGATQPTSALEDITIGGSNLRMITFHDTTPIGVPVAVQLARPLDGVDHVLANLQLVLFVLCVGGIALAAVLGRLAARRVLAPLAEVAETAQHISETEDLTSRIRVHADDEVGQLATRFNAMIERLQGSRAALDESVQAQRQLVADASHELRTPVTSLRTNIEVLLAGGELGEEDRRRLLADVVEQSEELSALVGDLIELARGDLPVSAAEDVRLDRLVAESVDRARRNSPEIRFETESQPVVVAGVAERLGRAVNNLLDNAARHSPSGGIVEVVVDSGGVTVRDHGSGIDAADLPYVFDRFYRGANARGRQGSGLGLAIVRQVAVQHGGSVSAANAPDGGALFKLELPIVQPERPDAAGADQDPRVTERV